MPVRMKALRSFRGEPGEGNAGDPRMVEAGPEFNVGSADRAAELERIGHAVPITTTVDTTMAPEARAGGRPPADNKAASAGPLPSVGGETGAETAPSSSHQDRPQRQPRSRRRAGDLDL